MSIQTEVKVAELEDKIKRLEERLVLAEHIISTTISGNRKEKREVSDYQRFGANA